MELQVLGGSHTEELHTAPPGSHTHHHEKPQEHNSTLLPHKRIIPLHSNSSTATQQPEKQCRQEPTSPPRSSCEYTTSEHQEGHSHTAAVALLPHSNCTINNIAVGQQYCHTDGAAAKTILQHIIQQHNYTAATATTDQQHRHTDKVI